MGANPDRRRIARLSARLKAADTALARARDAHKQLERRLAFAALHDPLTSLPNRRALLEYLAGVLERRSDAGSPVAVMFVTIDGCTVINNTFGFATSEELIASAARRFVQATVEHAVVGHFGTNQFVAVVERTAVGELRGLADRILAAFAQPVAAGLSEVYCSLSVGIACEPGEQLASADELVRNADTAMLQAKAAGRNLVRFFTAAMGDRLADTVALEADLRRARDNGEFELHFQPIVAPNGRVLAFEALVRWNHPSRGSVSPERFIPLAEESGIIVSLGSWILRRACLDFKLIAGRFPSARLAVNISTRQLQEADFEFTVRRILAETNTEPSRLELEITESVLLADIKAVLPALEHLREFGVSVSLDDFGTGYSSLAYLKRLPVDTLKIDRSFVRDISDSDLDSEIAQAIVALAQSLGLRVIAEGVETELQRTYLEYLGCDELQGFLFGGPLAAPLFLNAPLRPPLRPCSVVAGEYSAPIHTSKGNPRYARRA